MELAILIGYAARSATRLIPTRAEKLASKREIKKIRFFQKKIFIFLGFSKIFKVRFSLTDFIVRNFRCRDCAVDIIEAHGGNRRANMKVVMLELAFKLPPGEGFVDEQNRGGLLLPGEVNREFLEICLFAGERKGFFCFLEKKMF